jgi:hypothetical protein
MDPNITSMDLRRLVFQGRASEELSHDRSGRDKQWPFAKMLAIDPQAPAPAFGGGALGADAPARGSTADRGEVLLPSKSGGSWSIKDVLPGITGHGYEELAGIKDGGMAMGALVSSLRCAIYHMTFCIDNRSIA